MYLTTQNAYLTRTGTGATILRARGDEPLPRELIERHTPTVYAPEKHDSRSERFTYIPTFEVLDKLQRKGFEPFEVRTGGSRDRGKWEKTRHAIRLRPVNGKARPERHIGEIRREVVLENGHDGTSAYGISSALWRLICLNGMQVQEPGVSSFRIGHKGDILKDIIDATYTVIDEGKLVDKSIDAMKAIDLSPVQREEFAHEALTLRYGDEQPPIRPSAILHPRRVADQGTDLWRTLNIVQENLLERAGIGYSHRSETTRRITHRHTRPVQGIADNLRLNRDLWSLAVRYREAA